MTSETKTLLQTIVSGSSGVLVACALVLAATAAAKTAAAKQTIDRKCDVCGTVLATERSSVKRSGTAGRAAGGDDAVAYGRKPDTATVWSVRVEMDNGGIRQVDFVGDPGYRQGQRVRIVDGTISRL